MASEPGAFHHNSGLDGVSIHAPLDPCLEYGMLAWHVARTEPMKGFLAERRLVDDGFDVFLPKVREEKRWSRGRTHETVKPLIGGYIFTRFDIDHDGWQRINDAAGVVGLEYVAPELPVSIPDQQMIPLLGMCPEWQSQLEEYEDDDGVVRKRLIGGYVPKDEVARFKFKVGQIVRVKEGPFENWTAKVTRATYDKVQVAVEIFGRDTPVEGGSTMFEPV